MVTLIITWNDYPVSDEDFENGLEDETYEIKYPCANVHEAEKIFDEFDGEQYYGHEILDWQIIADDQKNATLSYLRKFVSELHWTGGMDKDGTKQYIEYELEFYRSLAFIVVFRDDVDGRERIIDNCVQLEKIDANHFKIIKIDGKALGRIDTESLEILRKQKLLISWLEQGEVFENDVS